MKSKPTYIASDVASAFYLLAQISSTSSRVEKQQLITAAIKNKGCQTILRELVLYALNPNWVYRVTSPAEFTSGAKKIPQFAAYLKFMSLLDELRTGAETPLSQVKQQIQDTLDASDKDTRKFLCMILDRDLKIGFRQWNKIFPGLLPEPKLMLCSEWDTMSIERTMYCEPKLDGLRLLLQIDAKGNATPLSRGGKPIYNLEQYILPQVKELGFKSCVLDGEVFAGNFGDSSSIAKSAKRVKADKLKFYVFDYIPLSQYKDDACTYEATLRERKGILHDKLYSGTTPNVVLLRYPTVTSVEQVERLVKSYMDNGFEGCVLKDPKSLYAYGRSKSWLKFKPQNTCDLEVYDAEPGQQGTRLAKTLGALLCKGTVDYKGKEFKVKVSVGGGLSDEWRAYFWKLYNKGILQGAIIEVKYQDCTEATLCATSNVPGAKYSLRFPRFIRLRDDK